MIQIQKTFKNNWPTIFLVTTPIGNLDDITYRAIVTLQNVYVIFCEDTRTSAILLKKYDINTPTKSLHKFNEMEKVDEVTTLLLQGANLAIISDAGVPCINDPGMYLLQTLLAQNKVNFNITSVGAGPAYIHSLVNSGYYYDKNVYLGFLPKKDNALLTQINNAIAFFEPGEQISLCFYESVHRIKKTLAALEKVKIPDFRITVCRELTKINEEIVRLTKVDLDTYLKTADLIEKGEFCVVLNFKNTITKMTISEAELIAAANELIKAGHRKKEALKMLSETYLFNFEQMYKLI